MTALTDNTNINNNIHNDNGPWKLLWSLNSLKEIV
jgi:hypothetical protein